VAAGPPTEQENKSIFSEIEISDQKIKILVNRPKGLSQDVGKPLDFQGRVGTVLATICLDTGGGANVVNQELIKNKSFQILKRQTLSNPIILEVGNSQEMRIEEAVLAELQVKGKKATAWWLVNPNLPLPALIGRPTAQRLGMVHDIREDKVSWEGTLLDNSNIAMGCHRTDPRVQTQRSQPPQDTLMSNTKKIPPRTMVRARLKVQKNQGPEGYFMPSYNSRGKLLLIPGIVDFDEKDELTSNVLILNLTSKAIKIRANTKVGETQVLTDDDVRRTELIELTNRSLTEIRALKKKDKVEKPKTKTPKEINVKVSMSYCNTIPGVTHDKGRASPSQFERIISENPSKEFLEGYLHGAQDSPDNPGIEELISLLLTTTKGEDVDMEQIPKQLQKAYKVFALHECELSKEQILQLAELLTKYQSIWDEEGRDGPLKTNPISTCPIKTKEGTDPLRSKTRRTTPAEDYIVWGHLEKMLKRRVIRPSKSPWASPILLADKKNGKVRFCVDYRRLNEVTVKDAYPLPRMEEILAVLGTSAFYSTLDLTDAFWSIPVEEQDIQKTAFISKYGLWEFISMPFGLTNAPATQQRFIEAVLNGLVWNICFAYIDDILCFSDTFAEHITNLDKILDRLQQHNLLIQPTKCKFCRPTFEILGFISTKDGLKPNPNKVKAIKNYPYPGSRKEAECFMGMISWLRRFIPRMSQSTRQIRDCMKQAGKTFTLTDGAKREVDILKEIMTSDICMAHPKIDKQFYIHVDASKQGVGAILTQVDEQGNHRVVEYASKALSNAQRKYSNSVREGYGILWALNHFKYYVQGRDPIVFCDCKCLSDLFRQGATKIPEHVSLRDWVARILQFSPKILHKPGRLMAIPDALSRHYAVYANDDKDYQDELLGSLVQTALVNRDNSTLSLERQNDLLIRITPLEPEEENVPPIRCLLFKRKKRNGHAQSYKKRKLDNSAQAETSEDTVQDAGEDAPKGEIPLIQKTSEENSLLIARLAMEQRSDPVLEGMIDYLQMQRLPKNRQQSKHIRATAHQYTVDTQGILRRLNAQTTGSTGPQAVLPRALWDEIIEAYHNPPLSGHRKYRPLLEAITDVYYFSGMTKYIKMYSAACVTCQRSVLGKKPTSPLLPYYASYPGILVHLDCTPGSKVTDRGNTHILAMIDSFSGYLRLYAINQPTAIIIAEKLLGYIAINSMPLKIVTDNGSEFANELMTELGLLLGLKQTCIAPYNSRSNGKVENSHKTTQQMVRAYIEKRPKDWDILIPLLEFAINTSKSSVTKYTPFYLHFGRHPIMPIDMIYEAADRPQVTCDEYVKGVEKEREMVIKWVNERRAKAAKASIERVHKRDKNKETVFQLGEQVLLLNPQRKGDFGKKYNMIFHKEVYLICDNLENGAYMIQDLKREQPQKVVNGSQLKKLGRQAEIDLHMHDNTISCTPKSAATKPLNEEETNADPTYEIHKVLKERTKDGEKEYLVWFKGYRKTSAQWCLESNLDAEEAIKDFRRNIKPSKTK
jgi:hypothetical protein